MFSRESRRVHNKGGAAVPRRGRASRHGADAYIRASRYGADAHIRASRYGGGHTYTRFARTTEHKCLVLPTGADAYICASRAPQDLRLGAGRRCAGRRCAGGRVRGLFFREGGGLSRRIGGGDPGRRWGRVREGDRSSRQGVR